jgi:hypothetical protein
MLAALMDNLETFDSTAGTDLVTEARSLMTQIEAHLVAISCSLSDNADNVKVQDIDGFYRVEYREGASAEAGTIALKDAAIARLRSLLDPNRQLGRQQEGGLILF